MGGMKMWWVVRLAAGAGMMLLLLGSGCKKGIIDMVNSPDIRIKVGTTVIGQDGEYDLGLVSSVPQDITCTIENVGLADLTLSGNPKVTASGSAAFTVSQQPVSPIKPHTSTTFTIRFSPADTAEQVAAVSIACDDLDKNPCCFSINGQYLSNAPEMNLKGPDGTGISDGSGSYAYSPTLVGSYRDAIFTVENLGNQDLLLNGSPRVQIDGTDATQFSVTVQLASVVVSSSSTTFTIRFSPTSGGTKNAAVIISNNDSDENPYNFSVTGLGGVAPEMNVKQGTTTILNNTGSYSFESALVGTNTDVVFTIENVGTADLNLTGGQIVEIGGVDSSQFSVAVQPSATIVPTSNTTFTVRFTPTSSGTKSAAVSIPNDDSDENPYSFPIYGTSTDWHGNQTVDSTFNVGQYNSIAVSGSNVYISYCDETNGDLKLAKSTDGGATWPVGNIKTVDSADDVGYFNSIAVNGSIVYISYLSNSGDLKFARSADGGATWPADSIKTVESPTGDLWYHTSIAVSGNYVYISYYDFSNADLKFAMSIDAGTTWSSAAIKTVDSTGNVGMYSSIAVVGVRVYISYFDSTNDDLKFAWSPNQGGSWLAGNIKTVDSTGTVGSNTSIAADEYNVYISYFDSTNGDLKFAGSGDEGVTWPVGGIKVVDATGGVGSCTSIAVDGSSVYISYHNYTSYDLKFAKSTDWGATWPAGNIKVVDAAGYVGKNTSIAVDGSSVYISHWNLDVSIKNLKFAKSIDGGGTW